MTGLGFGDSLTSRQLILLQSFLKGAGGSQSAEVNLRAALTEQGYNKAKESDMAKLVKWFEHMHENSRTKVSKIHTFYEKLLYNVESLQTLGSLNKLDKAIRSTFDKLEVIKNELAMSNDKSGVNGLCYNLWGLRRSRQRKYRSKKPLTNTVNGDHS